MKLAKEFKFLTELNHEYSAKHYAGTGLWRVTRSSSGDFADWPEGDIRGHITNGAWRVTEVIEGPEQPEELALADEFVVKHSTAGSVYTVKRRDEKNFDVVGASGMIFNYAEESVRSLIIEGFWIVTEVGPVATPFVEPEFLPPDDIEPVPDYGVLLSDLRRFTKDTGYSIEVDEDFYSFVYDGRVEYVVKDESDMAAVMQAIRTLCKFSDKG
jgi:hypothetical protein